MRIKLILERLLRDDPSAVFRPMQAKGIVLVAIMLIALTTLAAGLSNLQLAPADRFPIELFTFPTPPPGQTLGGGEVFVTLARIALAVMLVLTPVYLIYALINPKRRRQLFINLLAISLIVLMLSNISRCASQMQLSEEEGASAGAPPLTEQPLEQLDLPAFDPNAPDWLVLAVSVLLALVLAGLITAIGFGIARRRRTTTLEQVAQQAEQAVADLQAGGEFRDIIIRCYREMSRTVQEARGVRRAASMTPREFVTLLQTMGLPAEPVQQLTLAFEAVRYGHAHPTPEQEQAAIEYLRAIVNACRASGDAS
ncbi:MAG: DUF4129 domain-containing protein [Anaerolineae bacterium]|nr:DUF4129 domain-containing protein [Thermoflexales bacterium]MDW8407951.1 DUF4129 domain-containing protein [Anaerolineae bacterium]